MKSEIEKELPSMAFKSRAKIMNFRVSVIKEEIIVFKYNTNH